MSFCTGKVIIVESTINVPVLCGHLERMDSAFILGFVDASGCFCSPTATSIHPNLFMCLGQVCAGINGTRKLLSHQLRWQVPLSLAHHHIDESVSHVELEQ